MNSTEFWCKFWLWAVSSHIFSAENCEKRRLCWLFRKLVSRCTKNNSELRLVILTGLPPEATERLSDYLGRRQVVWPRYSLDEEQLFFQFTTTLVIWTIAWSVCLLLSFSLSWLSMWPQGCAKNLFVEFSEKIYRENTAFREISFPDSLFFT